jgi:hypothetical protein
METVLVGKRDKGVVIFQQGTWESRIRFWNSFL